MMDFSVRSRARVWAGTILGTLFCVVAAIAADFGNFAQFTPQQIFRSLAVDILLPTALAGPLLFLLLRQIRALAIARDEMAVMASTDSLTAILNRGAFTMYVEAYLAQAEQAAADRSGALLIIDADHFKTINDGFGHHVGDEALRRIAATIKTLLRPADLVGRIGGEEFGVFLPATTGAQASVVAERIRAAIQALQFPDVGQNLLSVSIGGVDFRNESDYDRLFRAADQCLYRAKNAGRNKVTMLSHLGGLAA